MQRLFGNLRAARVVRGITLVRKVDRGRRGVDLLEEGFHLTHDKDIIAPLLGRKVINLIALLDDVLDLVQGALDLKLLLLGRLLNQEGKLVNRHLLSKGVLQTGQVIIISSEASTECDTVQEPVIQVLLAAPPSKRRQGFILAYLAFDGLKAWRFLVLFLNRAVFILHIFTRVGLDHQVLYYKLILPLSARCAIRCLHDKCRLALLGKE